MANGTYEFDFSYDNGKWIFSHSAIQDGVLYIGTEDSGYGWGQRIAEDDWGCGANNNFEIEIDTKIYVLPSDPDNQPYEYAIALKLNPPEGDWHWIFFDFRYVKYLSICQIEINYDGEVKAKIDVNAEDFFNTNWHKIKVKRIGRTYYLDIDGTQINWTSPLVEKWYVLEAYHMGGRVFHPHNVKAAFDDIKYTWWAIEQEDYAFIM